jgi:fluoride ion exporter CrcB/FEX
LETMQLLKSGNYYWAFANLFLSIVVCFGLLMIFYKKLV